MPQTSLSITPTHLTLVQLNKRSGALQPKRLGVQTLSEGVLKASLTEPNIARESEFIEALSTLADKASFGRKLKLSVTLPEGSAHSLVTTLDQHPASRGELEQMLDWKISRTSSLKTTDMRMSYQQLSDVNGQARYLVSAVHNHVLEQYENILNQIGWQPGAIIPQHLGEAQWLLRGDVEPDEDQALVSVNEQGFVVVIVRGQEPLLVREVTCDAKEREDEFFRLLIFYRDRLNPTQPLKRILLIGEPSEQNAFSQALTSALDQSPQKLTPLTIGLNLDASVPFNRMAAAAGTASMAF